MKNLFWVLFTFVLLAGTSCQESIDIEAEKQLIIDKSTALIEAEQQKDVDATLSYYAEDVIIQDSDMPQIQGLEAFRNLIEGIFEIVVSFEAEVTEITVSESGDMAWDYAWYRIAINGANGLDEHEGKYLEVWQKINDEWKIVAFTLSSNGPAE